MVFSMGVNFLIYCFYFYLSCFLGFGTLYVLRAGEYDML